MPLEIIGWYILNLAVCEFSGRSKLEKGSNETWQWDIQRCRWRSMSYFHNLYQITTHSCRNLCQITAVKQMSFMHYSMHSHYRMLWLIPTTIADIILSAIRETCASQDSRGLIKGIPSVHRYPYSRRVRGVSRGLLSGSPWSWDALFLLTSLFLRNATEGTPDRCRNCSLAHDKHICDIELVHSE